MKNATLSSTVLNANKIKKMGYLKTNGSHELLKKQLDKLTA